VSGIKWRSAGRKNEKKSFRRQLELVDLIGACTRKSRSIIGQSSLKSTRGDNHNYR